MDAVAGLEIIGIAPCFFTEGRGLNSGRFVPWLLCLLFRHRKPLQIALVG